jgi:hypothetical protein
MRYLRKYDFFKEALAISTTDRPDEEHAKLNINASSEQLQQYFRIKPKLDSLYNSAKTDTELKIGYQNLLNQEKVKQFGKFLSEYEKICRIQREIEDTNRKRVLADANKSTLTGEKDLKELSDKIANFDKILSEKTKQMKDLMAEHKKLMIDTEKELKKDTQEIQSKK